MNATLTALQLTPDSTGNTAGVENKAPLNQEDEALSGGFAPLLDEAQAALPSRPADAAEDFAAADELALQLQSLPQGGKLLPLLEQVLDSAEQAGIDTGSLVERMTDRLEQLQADGETNPASEMALVLQQVLTAIPDNGSVAGSQTAVLAAVDGRILREGSTGTGQHPRAPLVTPDDRAAANATGDRAPPEESPFQLKHTGLDRALAQLPQADSDQRQSPLTDLLDVIKQRNPGVSGSADALPRTDVAGAAGAAAPPPSASSTPNGLPTLTLGAQFNQAGWDQALGERIQWLAGQNLQGARIQLNPAHLGPMEVRLQVQNDQASIQFHAAHGVVRDALEAALPRLREMFDASGVELVDVDVSGQSFAGQERASGERGDTTWNGGNPLPEAGPEAGPETVLETTLGSFLESGRLDLFA
ncbi:MAG TPA: hypothetical protein ENK49_05880 [Gammaproteobacteria bacterium]|nr:hypothetical protein [Gammaproteobacteria bacterium]